MQFCCEFALREPQQLVLIGKGQSTVRNYF
jgi:hypothetical protein